MMLLLFLYLVFLHAIAFALSSPVDPSLREFVYTEILTGAQRESIRSPDAICYVKFVDQADSFRGGGPSSGDVAVESFTELYTRSGDADLPAGTSIRYRFEVVGKIARGTFSDVYEVVDHCSGDQVRALKIALNNDASDTNHELEREGRYMNSCHGINQRNGQSSDHVINYLEKFYWEGFEMILFRKFDYDLGQLITMTLKSGRRLPLDTIAQITRQIVLGLHSLHAVGIAHNDLKPNNILISEDENRNLYVVVADLGLAQMEAVVKDGEWNSANAMYEAPDIYWGRHRKGRQSDLFALGAIIAEMYQLKPQFPRFDGNSAREIAYKRLLAIKQLIGTTVIGVDAFLSRFEADHRQLAVAARKEIIIDLKYLPLKKMLGTRQDDDPGQYRDMITLIRRCIGLTPSARPITSHLLRDEFFDSLEERRIKRRRR